MSPCDLEIQHVKKIKIDDDTANRIDHEPVVCSHSFWNEAPEDLLMEIFIRHPDCRSAAQTSTVCRLWRSLINRNPEFIRRFKSHHKMLPWTILFRKIDLYHPPEPQHFQNICQVYSEEWMFLHGKLPADCLDFLPSPMLVKASCKDLLLVSPGKSYTDDLYICNPITKQFAHLPAIPRPEDPSIYNGGGIGYAIVPMPNGQFKVVEVLPPSDYPNFCRLIVSLFCSESRKWEIRHFPCPLPNSWWGFTYFSNIIRCNEILFWVGTSWESNRIVYLDLSKENCGALDIPSGDKLLSYQIGSLHVSGGVQELRLIQLLSIDTTEDVHLKVWRLNNDYNKNNYDDDRNWVLVHNKKLKRPKDASKELPLTFAHPTNGDLVFLVWDKTVVEYDLINETYEKIAELLEIAYLAPFLIDLSSSPSNLNIRDQQADGRLRLFGVNIYKAAE